MNDVVSAPRRGPGALDLLSILVVLGLAALTVWVALYAPPGQYPVHIGLSGQVDRWADKPQFVFALGLMTGVTALIAALMAAFAHNLILGEQASRAGPLFAVGRVVALVAPAGAAGVLVAVGLGLIQGQGDQSLLVRGMMAFTAVAFIAMGDQLGRAKPNAIAGVRTYFTLTSRLAWDKSNRLVGRLFFWIGLLGLIAAPFAPQPAAVVTFFTAILLAAGWGVFEGWRVWKTDPERRAAL